MPFAICFSPVFGQGHVAPSSVGSGRSFPVDLVGRQRRAWSARQSWNDRTSRQRFTTVGGRRRECFTEVDKFLISLGQVSEVAPMRALVRSATLNGYLGLARSLDLDAAAADARRRAGPSRPRRPGQVDLGCRGRPAPRRLGRRVGRARLRGPARRAAPALHARAAERRAPRGARPAQRPEAPAALRAQLQRSPPDAPGRVGRDRHAPAVVRVRRARPSGPGACTGRCRALRHHP